ncbi:hypothetical protein [Tsukamurella tyrosinosolvens]|uniref:hypothetical protein n=1 Tax=Tsukamurella tyrosinosolvens TaxID=57704 RepID=UPI00111482CF|nr:hypothetical protein [Tsukamurella tyrosinosolvens]
MGRAQLDEIASAVASGTLDGEITFDMRDVHWSSLDETPTPYGTFVAHVLLHRHRLTSDRGAMAATCARIVTTPRLGEPPAWAEVAPIALSHPDAVVAGAAAAVEISTAACDRQELLEKVASEHRSSPLLPAALLFVESAVLAHDGVGEAVRNAP